jgi:ketosteroid isomerase-like protein
MSEARNLEIVRKVVERWNAGDFEGLLELYHEDTVAKTSAEWPEQAGWRNKDEMRTAIADWRDAWETSALEIDSIEAFGDNLLARGAWNTRGRASGLDGTLRFSIVFTLKDGKIAGLEWFTDHDLAVAAARHT